jgi:diguanylate cyclase (GGDEF)-like protein
VIGAGDPRTGAFRAAGAIHNGGRATALGSWQDRVLVGTSRGLVVLDATSGAEAPLDAAMQTRQLDTLPITAIRTTPGAAWIAGAKSLLRVSSHAPGEPSTVEPLTLPIAGAVSALSIAGTERLWVGSDLGEIVRAEWTGEGAVAATRLDVASQPDRESLATHGTISALHEDAQGRLWVGTRRGLGRLELESGKVTWLGQSEGLPSTNVAGMAGDADGNLWIGHNRGLTRIDPNTGAMMHFGEREGAQGNGYAEGAWAAGPSGAIYFAGEGITAFDPRQVSVSPYRPRIVFTGLEIQHRAVMPKWLDPHSPLDRVIDAQQEVTLGPEALVISVEMAPIHYMDPSSNRLKYWLEGFDPDWIETDAHNRVATYTNLAPGRYVLHALGGTKNGVWSEPEATLVIHILPPWWRTRAAIAAWAALSVVAVGLLWNSAQRRARVKLALLERETLRRESVTDPLTGLHNRRFLIAHLQHEVPKLLRQYKAAGGVAIDSGADLLLFLVDVDHFKAINDRHSHATGDRVLSQIAETLKQHLRESDLAVRWGGDEFLVVTRSFARAHASDVAERLRAAAASLGASRAAEGGPAITLSIGFAAFPFVPHDAAALSWEQTLELADHALRLTKSRRRNSYTGLRAGPGLRAAAVLEFISASGDRPLPPGIEVITPDDEAGRGRSA